VDAGGVKDHGTQRRMLVADQSAKSLYSSSGILSHVPTNYTAHRAAGRLVYAASLGRWPSPSVRLALQVSLLTCLYNADAGGGVRTVSESLMTMKLHVATVGPAPASNQ